MDVDFLRMESGGNDKHLVKTINFIQKSCKTNDKAAANQK
jgi:hypothetical protein